MVESAGEYIERWLLERSMPTSIVQAKAAPKPEPDAFEKTLTEKLGAAQKATVQPEPADEYSRLLKSKLG